MGNTIRSRFVAFLLILSLLLIGYGTFLYVEKHVQGVRPTPTCADDPSLCPQEEDQNLETFTDPEGVFSFSYPKDLGTTYLHPVDWPPIVEIEEISYSCTEAGNASERVGRTEEHIINGHIYCVTEEVEGAAGSVYSQYAYAFSREGKTIFLTFTVKRPQCVNYDEPQASACFLEQGTFSIDALADKIAVSFEFTH